MIKQLAILGDSLSNGTIVTGVSISRSNGFGSWAELIASRLGNIPGFGPLLGSGIRTVGVGLEFVGVEWSFSSGWTNVATTDAFDKLPYGSTSFPLAAYANGATKTATYNVPTNHTPVVGFALYYVDYTGGGNWQYSIDGGSWINMNQTLTHDNKIGKFYVATAVSSTVQIRASSDGTTGVGCLPAGIELFYVDPRTPGLSGFIVHNFAINGETLRDLVVSTSGDRMAIFDSVKLGTGNPISNSPNVGVIQMNINDVSNVANTTTWGADLTTLRNRVAPLGPVGFMNPWECNTAGYNQTMQTNYRAKTKTIAAGFSPAVPVLDFYDIWASNGWTGNTAVYNAGLLHTAVPADQIHESQLGHFNVAEHVYWWLRTKILTGLTGLPTTFPVNGGSATPIYSASTSSVAYSASLPIEVNSPKVKSELAQ